MVCDKLLVNTTPNNYIILGNNLHFIETHETWMELCDISLYAFKKYKQLYKKISMITKYFLPTHQEFFSKIKK